MDVIAVENNWARVAASAVHLWGRYVFCRRHLGAIRVAMRTRSAADSLLADLYGKVLERFVNFNLQVIE
jgi:hypothetical protein